MPERPEKGVGSDVLTGNRGLTANKAAGVNGRKGAHMGRLTAAEAADGRKNQNDTDSAAKAYNMTRDDALRMKYLKIKIPRAQKRQIQVCKVNALAYRALWAKHQKCATIFVP